MATEILRRTNWQNSYSHEFVWIIVRNSAINCPIKIADRLYVMPNTGGVMSNGFAHAVTRKSEDIWNSLSLFAIRRYRESFSEYFLENIGKTLPENPVFRFKFLTTETNWAYALDVDT